MTEPIDLIPRIRDSEATGASKLPDTPAPPLGVPSNPVYARVGDSVLHAAQDGVRRGIRPEDIIREIAARHDVRLNIGELRLLLASRRVPAESIQPH